MAQAPESRETLRARHLFYEEAKRAHLSFFGVSQAKVEACFESLEDEDYRSMSPEVKLMCIEQGWGIPASDAQWTAAKRPPAGLRSYAESVRVVRGLGEADAPSLQGRSADLLDRGLHVAAGLARTRLQHSAPLWLRIRLRSERAVPHGAQGGDGREVRELHFAAQGLRLGRGRGAGKGSRVLGIEVPRDPGEYIMVQEAE
jgi:hypothetical protein